MKFPSWLTVYGNLDYRGISPPESNEQITFFTELNKHYPDIARIAVHVRNEGKRTPGQAIRHKLEGMNTGAADIIIPGASSFVCEMKRSNHTLSKWEPDQLAYLKACTDNGAFVCVALGYVAALYGLEQWLTGLELG